ncbi:MAG: hypothetical protein A2284_03175 [Deltaproteobacteria bacterium RIFOXYA12_FULL_61_11]|nr:MAG: hypothetical protein A2284_03175 [Deltaproteobacteria bacterium RIFOXYA12_FULL_61_11]
MKFALLFALMLCSTALAGTGIPWREQPSKAFEEAKQQKKPLLVAFHTRWCPPCNYLNEFVYPHPMVVAAAAVYIPLKLDADAQDSFALKDRYTIGGYPTILFLAPDGTELGRLVGTEAPEQFAATLDRHTTLGSSVDQVLTRLGADQKLGLDLLRLARFYAETDRAEQALGFYTVAAELAKLPTEENLNYHKVAADWYEGLSAKQRCLQHAEMWLAAVEKTRALPAALARRLSCLDRNADPQVYRKEVGAALQQLLDALSLWRDDPVELAEVYVQLADFAELMGENDKRRLYLTLACESLEGALAKTRVPAKSLGLTLLAYYRMLADIEGQQRILEALLKAYPDEFTIHYHQAKFLNAQGRYAEGLEAIAKAKRYAYGDNALFVVKVETDLRENLARYQVAASLKKELERQQVQPSLKVRSHRYVEKLEKRIKDLEKPLTE